MHLKTTLYDYQRKAADKTLQFKGWRTILGYGTGKTRVALELAQRRLTAGKIDRVIWHLPHLRNR